MLNKSNIFNRLTAQKIFKYLLNKSNVKVSKVEIVENTKTSTLHAQHFHTRNTLMINN